jgi:hypothetical protein
MREIVVAAGAGKLALAGAGGHGAPGARRMNKFCILVAVAALTALSTRGEAETVAETVEKWGLIGLWSADCDSFPSARNTYLRFRSRRDGRIVLERDSGGEPDSSEIVAAEIAPDHSLTVRVRFSKEGRLREITYVKALPRVMREIENHAIGGAYTIKDARFVSDGSETLWHLRCYDSAPSARPNVAR